MLAGMRCLRLVLPLALAASDVACGPRATPAAALVPAGDHHDDGHGFLSHASAGFVTEDEEAAAVARTEEAARAGQLAAAVSQAALGVGVGYGGLGYGGDLYGGLGYAAVVPRDGAPAVSPMEYDAQDGLTGAIEGVVSWPGALPPRVTTACGAGDNPTLHVGPGRGVGGALVFIAKIETGRPLPSYARAATVGGVLAKRGCRLLPAAQIVAPAPAVLTIHGDATAARVRVTPAAGAGRAIALQEGGRAQLDAAVGVLRVDGEDGKLTPAWVVGLDTPYYAVTDDAGRFRIDELAAGTYDVTIWQAPVTTASATGELKYGAPIEVHRKVTVGATGAARLDVALR